MDDIPSIPKRRSSNKFVAIGLASFLLLGAIGTGVILVGISGEKEPEVLVTVITTESYDIRGGNIHGFVDQTYTFEDGVGYYIPADPSSTETTLIRNSFALPSFINPDINASVGDKIDAGFGVTLADGIVEIGNYSFSNQRGLKMIMLPYGLKSIGGYAFNNTINLEEVQIPDTVFEIGDQAFANSGLTFVSIPKSIISLGTQVFTNNKSLESVVFEGALNNIPMSSFEGCDSLTQVTLPADIQSIGTSAFADCSSLKNIHLGDSLVEIKEKSFSNTAIESLTIPKSVTTVGNNAFSNCDSLKYVELAEGVKTFESPTVFSGSRNIETIIIPSTLTKISAFAFSDSAANIKEIIVYSSYLTISDFDPSIQSKVKFYTKNAIEQSALDEQQQRENEEAQRLAEEEYQKALLEAVNASMSEVSEIPAPTESE